MTKSELELIVVVPLIVSIAANLVTPMVRNALIGAATRIAKALNILGARGVRVAIRQVERELQQLDELLSDNGILIFIAEHLLIQVVMLWIVVFLIGAVVMFSGGNGPHFNAQLLLASAFGGGGVQTFIGSMVVGNLVSKLKRPEEYRRKLENELCSLKKLVQQDEEI